MPYDQLLECGGTLQKYYSVITVPHKGIVWWRTNRVLKSVFGSKFYLVLLCFKEAVPFGNKTGNKVIYMNILTAQTTLT